jgi:flagellar hook-length control protein FliK
MIKPVIADMFMKSATVASQVAETGKATTDKAFQKIFDSSMQNSDKSLQSSKEANDARRSDNETAQETTRDTARATAQKTDASKTRSDAQQAASAKVDSKNKENDNSASDAKDAASAKVDSKNKESDNSASDAKRADEKTIADKVKKLKKSDPKAYNAMIANLDNMTLGNVLSTLGLSAADMSGLKPGVDLAGPVPEDMKQALISGDSKQINSAFAALGIGAPGNVASLPAIASQANIAIAGVTANAAGQSSANTNSDSQAATTAPANDSTTTPAGQASAKEVSPDNSKPQNGSSSADHGSQNGSSSADNANAGSSSAPVANAPTPESKPEVKAVDPFKLADTASQIASAQSRTDGAPQQTIVAKPAITVQNLTNVTDQASSINAPATNSDRTQAQSDARPADAPRQNFERMVLDQVVDKARFVVRPNGVSSMVIKLDPPTLGKIDMRVEVRDGVVRAAIVADNNDVKHAIESNIETLKQSLHASGLKVDEISVTVGGENGFQFRNDSMAQNAGSQNQGDSRRSPQGQAANAPVMAVDDSAPSRARAYAHSGILNVIA